MCQVWGASVNWRREITRVYEAMGSGENIAYVAGELSDVTNLVNTLVAASQFDAKRAMGKLADLTSEFAEWTAGTVSEERLREWAPLHWARIDDERRICAEETRRAS